MTEGIRRIRAGLYEHIPTGRLIVKTQGTDEGPRGGQRTWWEHAAPSPDGTFEIDGALPYATLRKAAEAL